jgi:hypothetical protein
MATAIPYAETSSQSKRRRVTAGAVISTLVFAATVFALALALLG